MIGQMVMAIGMMVGSLIAAQSFGIAGAGAFMGAAKGVGVGAQKGLQRYAGGFAARRAQQVTGTKAFGAAAGFLAKVPVTGFGGLARGMVTAQNKIAGRAFSDYDAEIKGLKTDEQRETYINSRGMKAGGFGVKAYAINKMAADGNLPDSVKASLLSNPDILKQVEGQLDGKGIRKTMATAMGGVDSGVLEFIKNGDEDKALKKISENLEKTNAQDIVKSGAIKDIFGDKMKDPLNKEKDINGLAEIRRIIADGFIKANKSGAIFSSFSKMNSSGINNVLKTLEPTIKYLPDDSDKEKEKKKHLKDQLDKAVAKRFYEALEKAPDDKKPDDAKKDDKKDKK